MKKQFFVITGLSGSGKTLALHLFEDRGFFAVDNLPAVLLPQFAEVCGKKGIQRIAVVVDLRGEEFLSQLPSALEAVKKKHFDLQILFFEAGDEALVRRFSETRRKHPLAVGGRILDGIKKERKLLRHLRGMAAKIINTSDYAAQELREELQSLYFTSKNGKPLSVSILSFGYKFGIPLDADLVFDVRFIANPYYEKSLKNLSGLNPRVKTFVLNKPPAKQFLSFVLPFLDFAIPQYVKEGKHHLTLAVGCTGGRHRSIVLANEIHRYLIKNKTPSRILHRDINR